MKIEAEASNDMLLLQLINDLVQVGQAEQRK